MNAILGHYVTIYMIHRPRPVDGAYEGVNPKILEQCILYAKKAGFEFSSIDEVVANSLSAKKPKRPTLCFTLDDGYQDQLDQLVPILLKHNCKPTLFTITDMVEGIDWPWDSKISFAIWNTKKNNINFSFAGYQFNLLLNTQDDRRQSRRQLIRFGKNLSSDQLAAYCKELLEVLGFELDQSAPLPYKPCTWESLRQAEKMGLRIGSHACSHRVFTSLSDAEVKFELTKAQQLLKQELNAPSKIFCYPSGTFNDFSINHSILVKETSFFIGAVTSMPGNTNQSKIRKNPFLINRHSFPDSYEKFIRYTSWLEYLRSKI